MKRLVATVLLSSSCLALGSTKDIQPVYSFSDEDRKFLSGLILDKAGDPLRGGNLYADDVRAAELGQRIFFDTRFSGDGTVACVSCHQPEKYFTDGQKMSVGMAPTKKNSPSVLLSSWSPWQFWDGRKDSLWSQALGPLESPEEHGISRVAVARLIAESYAFDYKRVFEEPNLERIAHVRDGFPLSQDEQEAVNRVFANVGKALMSYQRQLKLLPSRFDRFATLVAEGRDRQARSLFAPLEVEGLKVFVGKGNCISCHNGPLFTNFEFHNVGVPERDESDVDLGRYVGVSTLAGDEFTCLSQFSDASEDECLEMKFLKKQGAELVGAFKTPSLRNVAATGPYMHAGQFATLEEVVEHYNKPKPPFFDRNQHPSRPHFDILPLRLSDEEKGALVAFLRTLTSPIPDKDPWWQSPFSN